MRRLLVLSIGTAIAIAGSTAAQAARHAVPTALCRDGTASYSVHRSGTCSHHGGVARWLDTAPPSSLQGTPPPAGAAPASGAATIPPAVGRTILLGPRTQSSLCALGPNPDRACSPGAYYSGLTRAVICSPGFHTSAIRHVLQSQKHAIEAAYGLMPGSYGRALEIDHIVSLELGGSNDVANLFPELLDARPGYKPKDRLENRLHALVCSGRIGLRAAQRRIAANWQVLYRQVFGSAPVG